jgi:hypothetical protein
VEVNTGLGGDACCILFQLADIAPYVRNSKQNLVGGDAEGTRKFLCCSGRDAFSV